MTWMLVSAIFVLLTSLWNFLSWRTARNPIFLWFSGVGFGTGLMGLVVVAAML